MYCRFNEIYTKTHRQRHRHRHMHMQIHIHTPTHPPDWLEYLNNEYHSSKTTCTFFPDYFPSRWLNWPMLNMIKCMHDANTFFLVFARHFLFVCVKPKRPEWTDSNRQIIMKSLEQKHFWIGNSLNLLALERFALNSTRCGIQNIEFIYFNVDGRTSGSKWINAYSVDGLIILMQFVFLLEYIFFFFCHHLR